MIQEVSVESTQGSASVPEAHAEPAEPLGSGAPASSTLEPVPEEPQESQEPVPEEPAEPGSSASVPEAHPPPVPKPVCPHE